MNKRTKFDFPTIIKYVFGIGLLIFIVKIVRGGLKLGNDVGNDIKNNAAVAIINSATGSGMTATRVAAVQRITANIYDAFHKYFMGMFEDEEKAITNFNSLVSYQEAILCANLYAASYDKRLADEFTSYLTGLQIADLNTAYYNAVTNI